MDKLKMHSPDLSQSNIEKIKELFPNCVKEATDDSGNLKLAIDFDQLKQELSDSIVEGPQERYHLNWPGKREALLTANTPIEKTLRPCRGESVNFDITENLFIEGDNLDVLKLLQETYLGKVDVIYIDPPYNTGSDFLYKDKFSLEKEYYSKKSNEMDNSGNRLVSNSKSNGRFHSDWLSMMYPRLILAQKLLTDNGVIFISIDDCEYSNLVSICKEIFGSENYLGSFVWKRRSGAMDSISGLSADHEYVVAFGKSDSVFKGVKRSFDGYNNPDNDFRGPWKADNLSAGKPGGDVYYPIKDPLTGNEFLPPKGRYWPYSRATMATKIKEGRIIFPKDRDGRPMLKRFQSEAKSLFVPVSTWMVSNEKNRISNSLVSPLNTDATREVQKIFGEKLFPHPKSTTLIESLIEQVAAENSIILDFFAGSGSTAHATLNLNSKDGGSRKFILVQLPELCDEKSDAFKNGFKTISQLSSERIRLVAKSLTNLTDTGFRYLKTDTSNYKDVYYRTTSTNQAELFENIEKLKEGRNVEDIIFQVLIDLGLPLSLSIAKKEVSGTDIYLVDDGSIIFCIEDGLTKDQVTSIAKLLPVLAVFSEKCFLNDADKVNTIQIFKQYSVTTDIKVI